ncbi:MAG: hypothetical protein MUF54_03125 [Polyangiaceae bacterium]|nr:hypothetical protein [Polyangiaceae bacterium]
MRERIEIRAQEPVARCLMRRLTVPRIYFEAQWPGLPGHRIDVLAIDRDGMADAHLVEIRSKAKDAIDQVPGLLKAAAPYRWIAFLRGSEDEKSALAIVDQSCLYVPEKAGRVGIIEYFEMANHELGANVRLPAERFPEPTYDLSVAFAAANKASIQFGD